MDHLREHLKPRIFPSQGRVLRTNSDYFQEQNYLILLMEKVFVLCEGAAVFSYIIYVNLSLQKAIIAAKICLMPTITFTT